MFNNQSRTVMLFSILLIAAMIAGCSAPVADPTATPIPATVTPIPATPTPLPTETPFPTATHTATPLPPTATLQPSSTVTPLPTDTPTMTPTLTLAPAQAGSGLPAASGDSMRIYFIRLNTGGTVGCGDSAVAVNSRVARTGDLSDDVEAALNVLFAYNDEFYGDLYNPLYRSNIHVDSVRFNNGLITVELTGAYKPSGDDCDNTRVKAQVWGTIRQNRAVTATNIYLNGIPFGDRVSNDK